MHGRADRHLDGFQIELAALVAAAEQDAQESVYFARDFLADRFGRALSWGVKFSPIGRRRQVSSLTSRSRPLNSRKR
jgi:hypothetical protein